ncbi:MAG: response regulator [Candidatus Cloacimonetes bacterium]|nr:response regulator [Candidatus Cloacimonadota bacterium]
MFDSDILMIDDSESFCETVIDLIQEERGWGIEYVLNGELALQRLSEKTYKVILLDLKMPGMSGLELLSKLIEKDMIAKNYIIVLTGEITIENAVNSLQFGARDFVQKPSIVEFPENFFKTIVKGFVWQDEAVINEKLKQEKKRAIEDSQLIVKSVGHDMSGSYYGSLMLRLQMLIKKISKIDEIIENNIRPILKDISDEDELYKLKEEIESIVVIAKNGIERGQGIIELMHFFKELGDKLKHLGNAISIEKKHEKVVNLNSLVHSAMHVFADSRALENPEVVIVEEYYQGELPILVSEEDLLRVFLNLIENAYKAMDSKGFLTLKTKKMENKAIAIVSDTGCGIPKDKIEKIWRPDFTNWKNATGTGLGLMICRKVIENSSATITVKSEVDVGTEFILEFDLAKE